MYNHFGIFSVNVGSVSLPALLNIKQVMAQRQVAGMWNAKDELPVVLFRNNFHMQFHVSNRL